MEWRRGIGLLGAVLLGLWLGGGPAAVRAQDMPCTEEIQTYCADVKPGGGRIGRCLKDHEARLSPRCVQALADFERIWSGLLTPCRED